LRKREMDASLLPDAFSESIEHDDRHSSELDYRRVGSMKSWELEEGRKDVWDREGEGGEEGRDARVE
jgi:hypothetical protein